MLAAAGDRQQGNTFVPNMVQSSVCVSILAAARCVAALLTSWSVWCVLLTMPRGVDDDAIKCGVCASSNYFPQHKKNLK